MFQSISNSCYFGGDALSCVLSQLTSAFGGPGLFGLLLSGIIYAAFWIAAEGDLATPTVALILVGTVTVPMLPPSYAELGYAMVVIGLAAALWQVLQNYVLSGAVR